MTDFPFQIVGFDLDGTLLDTSGDLAAAVNYALADSGRPPLSVDAIRPMIGGGARHMLMQGAAASGGCSDVELDHMYRLLLDFYAANIAVHTRPFDGAMAAIDELERMGVRVAIVTNKIEALATKLIGELELSPRFPVLIGGDTLGPGKSKPDRVPIDAMVARCGGGRAAFVGDSVFDTQAARNAGIPSIAVSFGFLTLPVEQLGADAVIDTYAELIPTLRRLA